MLGKNISKETKIKIGEANQGENNGLWKGTKVGYNALHSWIKRHKPKSKFCEICNKNKPYDLANISQEYKRDIDDFEWLCRSCHMKRDGRINNLHKNKKRKIKNGLLFCSNCSKFLQKSDFYKNKSRIDGYYLLCIKCWKKYKSNYCDKLLNYR